MSTTYTPSTSNTQTIRDLLNAGADIYGAYPFANRVLCRESGLTLTQLSGTLQYLQRLGEWRPSRATIELRADPRDAGKELRRGTVLVRATVFVPR